MKKSVSLYIDSDYAGFQTTEKIYRIFKTFSKASSVIAEELNWDEVILYAVMYYDGKKGGLVSADFMLKVMPYRSYMEFYSSLPPDFRLFFRRNDSGSKIKEDSNENEKNHCSCDRFYDISFDFSPDAVIRTGQVVYRFNGDIDGKSGKFGKTHG